MEVIYQIANRELKLLGREGEQTAEQELFRNKSLVVYANGCINEN